MRLVIWDTASRKERSRIEWIDPLTSASTQLALAHDGAAVATATRDYGGSLRFAADGAQLVVPANESNAVEIFDVEAGKLIRTLDAGIAKPRGVAVSLDGQLLASLGSRTASSLCDCLLAAE